MPEKAKILESPPDQEFQIKLCTKLESLSVADTTFNVPSSINSSGLNTLVQGLLDNVEGKNLEFEWLCLGELLRGKLSEHVSKRNDITAETVIELEYIEKNLPPEPQVSFTTWPHIRHYTSDAIMSKFVQEFVFLDKAFL